MWCTLCSQCTSPFITSWMGNYIKYRSVYCQSKRGHFPWNHVSGHVLFSEQASSNQIRPNAAILVAINAELHFRYLMLEVTNCWTYPWRVWWIPRSASWTCLSMSTYMLARKRFHNSSKIIAYLLSVPAQLQAQNMSMSHLQTAHDNVTSNRFATASLTLRSPGERLVVTAFTGPTYVRLPSSVTSIQATATSWRDGESMTEKRHSDIIRLT
jgi:hypothetical protein